MRGLLASCGLLAAIVIAHGPCYSSARPNVHGSGVETTFEAEQCVEVAPIVRLPPDRRVVGRVRLGNGVPLPPGTQVRVARGRGFQRVGLDSLGLFEVDSLRGSVVALTIEAPRYHLTPGLPGSRTADGKTIIVGMLEDRLDLDVVLDENRLAVAICVDYITAPPNWVGSETLRELIESDLVPLAPLPAPPSPKVPE